MILYDCSKRLQQWQKGTAEVVDMFKKFAEKPIKKKTSQVGSAWKINSQTVRVFV